MGAPGEKALAIFHIDLFFPACRLMPDRYDTGNARGSPDKNRKTVQWPYLLYPQEYITREKSRAAARGKYRFCSRGRGPARPGTFHGTHEFQWHETVP